MLTIGALAELAGTTPRAVRHYHAVGVLPEPARRSNGYREYDLRDAVRLVRVRRLVELGLSLPEVADALRAGEDEQGLREVLVELDADLARQEQALRERRARLADLLERPAGLATSDGVAALLREISAAAPHLAAEQLAREREALEMLEATRGAERFAELATSFRTTLADPEQLAATLALGARFEALADLAADDPRVAEVARDLGDTQMEVPHDVLADDPDDESWRPAWAAFLATLPGAQARCMELAWERRAGCLG